MSLQSNTMFKRYKFYTDEKGLVTLNPKMCYVSYRTHGLERHHIFPGKNRSKSEEYGMCIWLHAEFHTAQSKFGIHRDLLLDYEVRQMGQSAFNQLYPDKNFVKEFGYDYLSMSFEEFSNEVQDG